MAGKKKKKLGILERISLANKESKPSRFKGRGSPGSAKTPQGHAIRSPEAFASRKIGSRASPGVGVTRLGKKFIKDPALIRKAVRKKHPKVKGDKSRGVDKHGRATHDKSGDLILRFRGARRTPHHKGKPVTK